MIKQTTKRGIAALLVMLMLISPISVLAADVGTEGDLRSAINSASSDTFTLTNDIDISTSAITIGNGKDITIDGGGKAITVSPAGAHFTFDIANGGRLTLKNIALNGIGGGGINNKGTLIIDGNVILADFQNKGAIDNAANAGMMISGAAVLNNTGTITNAGIMTNTGIINNAGTIINDNIFDNYNSGNGGTINNTGSGTIHNYGNFNAGSFCDWSKLISNVSFTAQGSVNLQNPGNLVFSTNNTNNLSGFAFAYVQFSRVATPSTYSGELVDGTDPLNKQTDPRFQGMVAYTSNSGIGTLTVSSAAFASHAAPGAAASPLPSGTYNAKIVFTDGAPTEYTYYTSFTLTSNNNNNSGGGGGGGGGGSNKNPDPPSDTKQTVTLTPSDLDKMLAGATNGVMYLFLDGNLENLTIDVPLSWFMENLGVTLLVYNEHLGLMAITSENMIELAALSYNGEANGVTMTINGRDVTFLPDTIISYNMQKGSVKLTVTANGNPMDWYVYDSPLTIGIPNLAGEKPDKNFQIVYQQDTASEKILPRSLVRGGLTYALLNGEGTFDMKRNPVSFKDVSSDVWMNDAVEFVAARGIMSGVGDNLFDPSGLLTRAQYTNMLMRMLDYDMTGYDNMPFNDIDPGSWYYDNVCKAAALGIVAGVGDGRFAPDRPVTRQEIFTMTYHALVKFYMIIPGSSEDGKTDSLASFSDSGDVSGYAIEAMNEMVGKGMISGDGERLNPLGTATRAEGAQLMANILDFMIPDYTPLLP